MYLACARQSTIELLGSIGIFVITSISKCRALEAGPGNTEALYALLSRATVFFACLQCIKAPTVSVTCPGVAVFGIRSCEPKFTSDVLRRQQVCTPTIILYTLSSSVSCSDTVA